MTCAKTIHFTKMHGAGNDYIYVEDGPLPAPPGGECNYHALSRLWSDRHTGIGADGLVVIGRPSDPDKADFSMRIFNADGSEAMMCGNASRCIGKYVYEKGLTDKTTVRLETKAGIKVIKLNTAPRPTSPGGEGKYAPPIDNANQSSPSGEVRWGAVKRVTVDMGEPSFYSPSTLKGHLTPPWEGLGEAFTFVSMGNPHCVVFVDDAEHYDVETEGRRLEYEAMAPERVNVEFVSATHPHRLRMRVWERGSGITMACGTGACATAVAAIRRGIVRGRTVDVVCDGGTLSIEWREADNHVYMTGPAEFVFEGDIEAGFALMNNEQ